MKKLKFVAIAAFVFCCAHAMPTTQEIATTRPLVSELMAPVMAEYKAKTKTATEVANTAIGFAGSAKSEAACYLFLRGAVGFYVKGGEFSKAADAVDALKEKVSGIPPADIANIISSALDRENARKAPRLRSQLQLAQAQVRAAKDVNRLSAQLERVSTDDMRRQYAEALALSGDWKTALAEFAKVSGTVGKSAKSEAAGSSSDMEKGDFWWGYEPRYAGTERFFRDRAAGYYRKVIADGKVDGLKKTLIDQRLASLTLSDVDVSAADEPSTEGRRASTPTKPSGSVSGGSRSSRSVAAKNPQGLVHRWSFTDGFADSVGNVKPSKSDNATVENGAVALRSGSPLEFPAGTVPRAPFTIQVWASATEKGLGSGDDFIFKLAPSAEGKNDSVFWRWTATKKWFSRFGAFGKEQNCYAEGGYLLTGKPNLYTLTAEKDGKGMLLKFYRDDTVYGTLKTEFALRKPPALILGGFITPTYDEIRIYSRALTHAEIIKSVNEGPEKLPELGKGK